MTKTLIINFPDEETRESFVNWFDVIYMKEEYPEDDYVHPAHHVNQRLITYQLPDRCEEGELNRSEVFNLLVNGCRNEPWKNSPNRFISFSG